VRELGDLDLGRKVALDRLVEPLTRAKCAAGEGPPAGEGLARALPEEHAELLPAHLEDDGQNSVLGACGRINQ